MTFGGPLGFYYLVAGTSHGTYALSQSEYEQATRELAPALLLGTLYAGGKGLRALSEARGVAGAGTPALGGRESLELRLRGLQEMARRVEVKLGAEGMRELARDIRARREAGHLVAVGGVDAALALREAGGDVARAQALMSKARPGVTGSSAARSGKQQGSGQMAGVAERLGGLASLVDEGAGLTREVVEARLALVELETPGPRLPRDVALLEADAALPQAQRRFLGAFIQPRIHRYVGVRKPESGLRYADVLVIEEGGASGGSPRVETFSFKSRSLSELKYEAFAAQMIADTREALQKYGGTLDIRRDSLQPLLRQGSQVPVQRVCLVYEEGVLKPGKVEDLKRAVEKTRREVPGVEVLFQ